MVLNGFVSLRVGCANIFSKLLIAVHHNFFTLIGSAETKKFFPTKFEYVGSYDPNVDASATAEFSHATMRVYHSNLADNFQLVDANNTVIRIIPLDESDNGLSILEEFFDECLGGMVNTPAGHASFTAMVSFDFEIFCCLALRNSVTTDLGAKHILQQWERSKAWS